MKQTRTESLLTADLYTPYYANIGQIICANVAALRGDWKQQNMFRACAVSVQSVQIS